MRASPHAFAEKGNFCVPEDNSGLAPALVCVAKKMFIRPFHAPFFFLSWRILFLNLENTYLFLGSIHRNITFHFLLA